MDAAHDAPPSAASDQQELRSLEDTARFFDVSVPTVRAWLADGCPVHRAGGNGVAYELDLRAVHKWRSDRDGAEARASAEREERNKQLRLELLGADALTVGDGERLSIRQISEAVAAEARRTQLAIMRREYVPAANMRIAQERAFKMISERLRALPDQLAQRFGLSDQQADAMIEQIDALLHDLADAVIADQSAPAAASPAKAAA